MLATCGAAIEVPSYPRGSPKRRTLRVKVCWRMSTGAASGRHTDTSQGCRGGVSSPPPGARCPPGCRRWSSRLGTRARRGTDGEHARARGPGSHAAPRLVARRGHHDHPLPLGEPDRRDDIRHLPRCDRGVELQAQGDHVHAAPRAQRIPREIEERPLAVLVEHPDGHDLRAVRDARCQGVAGAGRSCPRRACRGRTIVGRSSRPTKS